MNFGSDHRVRDAFRATLLDEPSSAGILGTQEVDAADVLEVADLANAIARAEEALRARSSAAIAEASGASDLDIFDSLTATDDAVGPAVHAPYIPTPLPPRLSSVPLPPGVTGPATLLRGPEATTPIPALASPPAFVAPSAAPLVPPAPHTAPILILDEDAFYHPAGRIRTLADGTLDGYRPEPTILVRLRERRTTLSWLVLLVLAPLILLAVFAIAIALGRGEASPEAAPPAPTPVVTTTTTHAAPPPVTAAPATTTTTHAAPSPVTAATDPTATAVPVFDVNSLKNAPPPKKSRR